MRMRRRSSGCRVFILTYQVSSSSGRRGFCFTLAPATVGERGGSSFCSGGVGVGGGHIGRLSPLVRSLSPSPPTTVQSAAAVIESEPLPLPCRGGSASQSFPCSSWSNKVPPRQHLPAAPSSLCPTGRKKVFNTSCCAPVARPSMPANQRSSRLFGPAMLPMGFFLHTECYRLRWAPVAVVAALTELH